MTGFPASMYLSVNSLAHGASSAPNEAICSYRLLILALRLLLEAKPIATAAPVKIAAPIVAAVPSFIATQFLGDASFKPKKHV